MEILIAAVGLGLIMIILGLRIERRLDKMDDRLRVFGSAVIGRQSRLQIVNRSEAVPRVERAVTTRRDTDDLPATARIVTGVRRVKRSDRDAPSS